MSGPENPELHADNLEDKRRNKNQENKSLLCIECKFQWTRMTNNKASRPLRPIEPIIQLIQLMK